MATGRSGAVRVIDTSTSDKVAKTVGLGTGTVVVPSVWGGYESPELNERKEQVTFIPWIVIGVVVVAIGIGTRIAGGGNPNFKLSWGSEKPWRSS